MNGQEDKSASAMHLTVDRSVDSPWTVGAANAITMLS